MSYVAVTIAKMLKEAAEIHEASFDRNAASNPLSKDHLYTLTVEQASSIVAAKHDEPLLAPIISMCLRRSWNMCADWSHDTLSDPNDSDTILSMYPHTFKIMRERYKVKGIIEGDKLNQRLIAARLEYRLSLVEESARAVINMELKTQEGKTLHNIYNTSCLGELMGKVRNLSSLEPAMAGLPTEVWPILRFLQYMFQE